MSTFKLRWPQAVSSLALTTCFSLIPLQAALSNIGESADSSFQPLSTLDKSKAGVALQKTAETKRYFVILKDEPVATYKGGVAGFKATSIKSNSDHSESKRLKTNTSEVQSYAQYLKTQQNTVMSRVEKKMSQPLEVLATTQYALNGMLVEMSPAQAKALEKDSSVKMVVEDSWRELHTDAGPTWIGANQVWDGSATGTPFQGEGVIVGIIDTGINPNNPAFAGVGGDGYIHTNPFGAGSYRGDCVTDPTLCNDKLIGVFSWPEITDQYDPYQPDIPKNGMDYDGHGSHVASTAAGNVLLDVPVYNAAGEPSDVSFERMSGVMPHANIISYQVCLPGDDGDPLNGCLTSLTALAVEEAIKDGVSVLNYSIGGGSRSPWQSLDALAFLAAREAGIHVATSAGNSGPGAGTVGSPAEAPWITAVANLSHNRSTEEKFLQDFSGGDESLTPPALSGSSLSGSVTAPIVYAGDYPNPNDPEGDPAQCLQPYPEGTFNGEIVVCDRGAIARVAKGIHVAAGGAVGFVLANTVGGATSVDSDAHVIPAIHINAESGTPLRAWLAQGTDHMATITGTSIIYDDSLGNVVNASSSRGPNLSVPNSLAVNVGAPGTSIYGAYAPTTPFKGTPNGSEFAFLSGTSMASPHVAGALAAIAGLRPDWTPAEAQSALMLTANPEAFKEDGRTPADSLDVGAGVVRIPAAINSGLVMDETIDNYEAANTATGGAPETLNIPQLVNSQCVLECQFTRTFEATRAGSWSIVDNSGDSGLIVTAVPSEFTLAEGESVDIQFLVDVSGTGSSGQWVLGDVQLVDDTSATLHIPVTVVPSFSNLPLNVSTTTHRDQGGTTLKDLKVLTTDSLTVGVFGLSKAEAFASSLPQDSDNSSAFDDTTDGVEVFYLDVTEATQRVVAKIISSESPDLDLFVGLDVNGDGVIDPDSEIAAQSASGTALESVDFVPPLPGRYWIVVQNWQASAPDADDAFELVMAAVEDNGGNLTTDLPLTTDQNTLFDSNIQWNLPGSEPGDYYFGLIGVSDGTSEGYNVGTVAVDVIRGVDDVTVSSPISTEEPVDYGDEITYTITILGNDSDEAREYDLSLTLSPALALSGIDFNTSTSEKRAGKVPSFGNNSSTINLNNIVMEPGSADRVITVTAEVKSSLWFGFNRKATFTVENTLDQPGAEPVTATISHPINIWSIFRWF